MGPITNEILTEFKLRMKLEDEEDANLMRILKASHDALYGLCGRRDISRDERFKEIVFERSRYAYNDALEYFTQNFLSEINSMGLEWAIKSVDLDGE